MNSASFFTPSDGCTTRMFAVSASVATAARSLPNRACKVFESDSLLGLAVVVFSIV